MVKYSQGLLLKVGVTGIPKRSLKKYLEPNYDYQISDFAKGVVKVYIDNKFQ